MIKKIIYFSLLALFLNACATPHVVSVVGPNDNNMSCSQLDGEIAIASNFKRDAKGEKSLGTATNVLIWNEVNTGTAPVDPPGWQEVSTNAA